MVQGRGAAEECAGADGGEAVDQLGVPGVDAGHLRRWYGRIRGSRRGALPCPSRAGTTARSRPRGAGAEAGLDPVSRAPAGIVDRDHRRGASSPREQEPGLQAASRLPGPSRRGRLSRRRSGFSRRFKVAWGRVVPRVDRPEHVRTRHLRLLGELLDARRPDLPEGGLDRDALVHGREEEIARELGVAKVLRQSLVPVSAGSCHVAYIRITTMVFGAGQSTTVVP